nr:immunoglobulin light chain junction region [Macaca mulatta]
CQQDYSYPPYSF